jgi:hypothetical protein
MVRTGGPIGAVDAMIPAGTSAGITTRQQEPRTSTFTHLQMQRVRIQSRRVSPSKSRSWSRERSTNSGSGVRYEQSCDAQHRRQPTIVGHADREYLEMSHSILILSDKKSMRIFARQYRIKIPTCPGHSSPDCRPVSRDPLPQLRTVSVFTYFCPAVLPSPRYSSTPA